MKTGSKISSNYTKLLHEKIGCLGAFSEIVLSWKQAQKKVNHCYKKMRKVEKGNYTVGEKLVKKQSLKTGHFLIQSPNFDFCLCLGKSVVKCGASE